MDDRKLKKLLEQRHISRRQFLVGSGSALLSLPPLLSLMPREVAAQVASTKKVRTVIYTGLLGIDQHQLYPTPDPIGLAPIAGHTHTYAMPLSSFPSTNISRLIDGSFSSVYPKMNLIRGLSLTGGDYQGHNLSVLAGSHSGHREPIYGKSIDVIMEQSQNVYPSTQYMPHKAIRLQTRGMSFDRVNGNIVTSGSIQGDRALFNLLFGSSLPGSGTSSTQDQINTNKKLIVDQVYADLKVIEKNPQLSSSDKNTLGQFIASIFDLQKKVQQQIDFVPPTCNVPTLSLQAKGDGNYWQFPQDTAWGIQDTSAMYDNYIEMIRLAFACDLTRIVYIGNSIWSDQPISPNSDGGLHHECASSELAADRQKWGLLKMAKLAQRLDATSDPLNSSGTLLDNSFILFTNELGAWTASHNTFSIPVVTFGSAGGFFKTGHYVDYTQRPYVKTFGGNFTPGRPYKQLLQSIMLSMGVPKSEYMQFGDGNGFGEFEVGINQFGKVVPNAFAAYANEHNEKLPFVS